MILLNFLSIMNRTYSNMLYINIDMLKINIRSRNYYKIKEPLTIHIINTLTDSFTAWYYWLFIIFKQISTSS